MQIYDFRFDQNTDPTAYLKALPSIEIAPTILNIPTSGNQAISFFSV